MQLRKLLIEHETALRPVAHAARGGSSRHRAFHEVVRDRVARDDVAPVLVIRARQHRGENSSHASRATGTLRNGCGFDRSLPRTFVDRADDRRILHRIRLRKRLRRRGTRHEKKWGKGEGEDRPGHCDLLSAAVVEAASSQWLCHIVALCEELANARRWLIRRPVVFGFADGQTTRRPSRHTSRIRFTPK